MPTIKKCECCEALYSCASPARGCWCESVSLTKEMLFSLSQVFNGCLCPRCLHFLGDKKNPPKEAVGE